MPTKNPRVNVVLEPPVYRALSAFAQREGVSMSLKARDLIREALEGYEDLGLASLAKARLRTYRKSHLLSQAQLDRRLGSL